MTCQHETTRNIGTRGDLVFTCSKEAPWFCAKDKEPKCIAHSHTEACCRPLAREGA